MNVDTTLTVNYKDLSVGAVIRDAKHDSFYHIECFYHNNSIIASRVWYKIGKEYRFDKVEVLISDIKVDEEGLSFEKKTSF